MAEIRQWVSNVGISILLNKGESLMSDYAWNETDILYGSALFTILLRGRRNFFFVKGRRNFVFFLNSKVKETFNFRKTYAKPQIGPTD